MAPGSSGRFVMSEDFMTELRVGRKTELGSQLEIPKVQPVLSFVLFLMNFSCAGTFMNVQALQGPEIGREYLLGICNSSLKLTEGGLPGLLHPLLSCFQAPGPLELCVALYALAVVGPRVEAAMGGFTFAAVYLLSGYNGALSMLLLQQAALFSGSSFVSPADASCGASASLLGMCACLAVYQARNSHLENEGSQPSTADADSWSNTGQQGESTSESESGRTGVSGEEAKEVADASRPPLQEQQQQRLILLVNAVGVVVGSLALAALHKEGPYEGLTPVSLLPTLVGGVTGGLLTHGMGPSFYVQQEVQIPEGSMFIPENAQEMAMLLDRTTGLQRGLVASGSVAALLALAQILAWLQSSH